MTTHVIGIDGGGTKTIGVLVNDRGEVLARKVGESSNFQVIGLERLGQGLEALVADLLSGAQISSPIDHLYAGLAGAGRPADREAIYQLVASINLARDFTIDTDAAVALAGAFAGGPGIILISGTGSICFGKDESDEMVRSGGWGYLLGDEGSGYYIGNQGILAALKDLDGRGQSTVLRQRLETHIGLQSIDLIVSKIYSSEWDRTKISALAPLVFDVADQGDAVAKEIIHNAGLELGKQIAAVVKKLGKSGHSVKVALIGSVFKRRDALTPAMSQSACQVAKEVRFIKPRFEPAIGAAILGLKKAGVKITDSLLATLDDAAKELQQNNENQ